MATIKVKPPRAAASAQHPTHLHGSTPARHSSAALGTRKVDGVSDLPPEFEATWLPRLRGLLWIVKAGAAGPAAAAAAPLPGHDEAVARQMAKRFAPSLRQRAFAQRDADAKAGLAEAALRAMLLLARTVSPESPVPQRFARQLAAASITADRLGRAAEKAHRVLALLLREQGGVH